MGPQTPFVQHLDEISVERYAGGGGGKKGDKQINCKYLKCIVNCRTEPHWAHSCSEVTTGRKEGAVNFKQLDTIKNYNFSQ